ncbi:uncharacterized protein LOC119394721 [Rhipicephalus sanguineus]|uniref:uncharacterized protein LOC119394721 n=1 Tax=Rhipicephalus sanguineus TaxID=34632 RepID=UPI001893B47C|nr:uncharacterized protein LOC119394721 [Rhipicephalus sanguineus]
MHGGFEAHHFDGAARACTNLPSARDREAQRFCDVAVPFTNVPSLGHRAHLGHQLDGASVPSSPTTQTLSGCPETDVGRRFCTPLLVSASAPTPAPVVLHTPTVQAPEEPKASIAVLDDQFHEGHNLDAEDTRSNLSNESNAEGRAADDTGREQGFPPRISNSATLPETTTTFAQVPAPLVSGAPFASVPEDLMSRTTVLTDQPEPLPEHSLTKCAPHNFTRDERENVALWIIPELIEIRSSFPKKPALEPPAKEPGVCSRMLFRQASLAVPRPPLTPRHSRSPPPDVCMAAVHKKLLSGRDPPPRYSRSRPPDPPPPAGVACAAPPPPKEGQQTRERAGPQATASAVRPEAATNVPAERALPTTSEEVMDTTNTPPASQTPKERRSSLERYSTVLIGDETRTSWIPAKSCASAAAASRKRTGPYCDYDSEDVHSLTGEGSSDDDFELVSSRKAKRRNTRPSSYPNVPNEEAPRRPEANTIIFFLLSPTAT